MSTHVRPDEYGGEHGVAMRDVIVDLYADLGFGTYLA